ncbi:hypothetical protein K493DRAFT_308258 [Basidiobolus meristosporus CBS 931.73]|uniref:Secreted protein n=1 Tax=Basidiobolus meristosporus CBS 931.73 TaxID=1314790 RepID=A0A1Y1X4S6_9FUNG|nr:hypothetical protein K493DRAFT_308258 [Basidiobolus meristosporus CBS 931.73]|eukprot:ORX80702.1 hypothetical protein K493DRAFT_308258 [Basidiobolus meristosporus CBS 931.73]
MKFGIILFSIAMLTVATQCSAWCPPWKSGSSMYVCKAAGKAKCINVSSGDACINLTGGPFISGYSAGSHKCTIYSAAVTPTLLIKLDIADSLKLQGLLSALAFDF